MCHHGSRIEQQVLAPWLASFSNLAGMIVIEEPPGAIRGRARRELRRVGPVRFADVAAFRAYYKLMLAGRDAAWESRVCRELKQRYPPLPENLPVLHTGDPNDTATAAFVRGAEADLMVARCRMLLHERVFSLPRLGTVIFHPGITPEYRNSHGCFWALANRDLDRVGMTLLKIDAGVDTGPVYGYYGYDYDERTESHVVIQKRVVLENLDAIREQLIAIDHGQASPIDTAGRESHAWGQPWLTRYLRWRWQARSAGS